LPSLVPLKYLSAYPEGLKQQIADLIAQGRLGEVLLQRYPQAHCVRTDRALYDYVAALKAQYLRNAEALSKVAFDARMQVVAHALGTHTAISRVQGGKLKAKREIRVASVFRDAPEAFLRMIVVHELAHLRERNHDKAFYQLCRHMEPAYHQLEFDVRAWLCWREQSGAALWGAPESTFAGK
jgi:predicted metal-dependent hydrolase